MCSLINKHIFIKFHSEFRRRNNSSSGRFLSLTPEISDLSPDNLPSFGCDGIVGMEGDDNLKVNIRLTSSCIDHSYVIIRMY